MKSTNAITNPRYLLDLGEATTLPLNLKKSEGI